MALDILIAGGGIGGLTAALALQRDGHRVTVCEATAELKPLGVGINLLPHAVAVLDGLGLDADVADDGGADFGADLRQPAWPDDLRGPPRTRRRLQPSAIQRASRRACS